MGDSIGIKVEMANSDDHSKALYISLDVPRVVARIIHQWARQQHFPPGTKLEHPKDYHITLLSVPDAGDHKDDWWVSDLKEGRAKIKSFHVFPQGDNGYPYVLLIDSPEIQAKGEELIQLAKWNGLSITHPDYKPHITVGYGEHPNVMLVEDPPMLSFDIGPSIKKGVRLGADALSDDPPTNYSAFERALLDNLSLRSIVHNLHRKFDEGPIDSPQIVHFIKRMLKLIGYPDDDVTVQTVIDGWHQLYPGDMMLPKSPSPDDIKPSIPEEVSPTVPTNSWEYGAHSGSLHTAMALDPENLQDYIKENGPYMAHWTKREHVPRILNEGIRPWSHPHDPRDDEKMGLEPFDPSKGHVRATWNGIHETRPGYIYLADPHNSNISPLPILVDLRKLNLNNLEADEDHILANLDEIRDKAVERGLATENDYKDKIPNWNHHKEKLWQWAERMHPEDPENTYDSLKGTRYRRGTLAHKGPIPPDALLLHPDYMNQYDPKVIEIARELGQLPTFDRLSPQKVAMALNPEDAQQYIKEKGPYLHHWTRAENVPRILREGLQPASHGSEDYDGEDYEDEDFDPSQGHVRRNWDGMLETRPDYVYMADPHKWMTTPHGPYEVPLRIDMRKLNPENLEADEDYLVSNWPQIKQRIIEQEGLEPDEADEYLQPPPNDDEEYPRWQWAEETDVMPDPQTTNESLQAGTIAHKGPIPAEAISLHPDYMKRYPPEAIDIAKQRQASVKTADCPICGEGHIPEECTVGSTVPTQVNDPEDNWQEFAQGDDYTQHRNIPFGTDWMYNRQGARQIKWAFA